MRLGVPGQSVPVLAVDAPRPLTLAPAVDGELDGVGAQRPDRDRVTGHTQLDLLAGADQPPRHRIHAGVEVDQRVGTDGADVPLTHDVWRRWDRQQRRPVAFRPDGDDLAVCAVHPARGGSAANRPTPPAPRPPTRTSVPRDVGAGDLNHAFDAALGLRPVRCAQSDRDAVVVGERDRLRVQRCRLVPTHVATHDRLGAVVHDRGGHAAEVIERLPVARPERRQIPCSWCTGRTDPAKTTTQMEAVHRHLPSRRRDGALLAPVDLGLRPRRRREPGVKPRCSPAVSSSSSAMISGLRPRTYSLTR